MQKGRKRRKDQFQKNSKGSSHIPRLGEDAATSLGMIKNKIEREQL
jgi:hypothetical protein